MLNNKKGAALLQVLLVTVVLAGMATMLLRASLSRTTTARQTRRTVSAQLLVNACMAEVNTIWSIKTPDAFKKDMEDCTMFVKSDGTKEKKYHCEIPNNGITYTVTAEMTTTEPDSDGQCSLTYTIEASDGDIEF